MFSHSPSSCTNKTLKEFCPIASSSHRRKPFTLMPPCRHFEWSLPTETKLFKDEHVQWFELEGIFFFFYQLPYLCNLYQANCECTYNTSASFIFTTERNHDCNSQMLMGFFFFFLTTKTNSSCTRIQGCSPSRIKSYTSEVTTFNLAGPSQ